MKSPLAHFLHDALAAARWVACFIAYLCSGHSGIYRAQRVAVPKSNRLKPTDGAP